MTTFEIRTRTGKRYTVAQVERDTDPHDKRGALRILEDQCEGRDLDITRHTIRAWCQYHGHHDHGSTT
jgi:hypothetical protein